MYKNHKLVIHMPSHRHETGVTVLKIPNHLLQQIGLRSKLLYISL